MPRSLPKPELPMLRLLPDLVVPALSLAFIGLVQGAGITDMIGEANIDATDERVGATLKRAHADAVAWIEDAAS